MRPALRTALVSASLVLGGAVALGTVTDHFQAFTTETARRLAVQQHPVELPAVVLQTQSGGHIRLADFRGKWLLVDFIYTRCLTYCLALGGEFAQLQQLLAEPIAAGEVGLLSISFDPTHDTPRELALYQQRFLDHGIGWTAARPVTAAGLGQLERAFGITVIPNPLGGYTHNDAIHVVDPQGRLVEILDMGDPRLVVEALERRLAR